MSTFKVNVTKYDWDKLCQTITKPKKKYLAVRHVKSKKRDHVHVYVEEKSDEYDRVLKDLQNELREDHQRQGPVKKSNKPIDEQFLNYMVKEEGWENHIAANRGFTDVELREAHEKSLEYCDDLKHSLKSFIEQRVKVYRSPKERFNHYKDLLLEYYRDTEKYIPMNPRMRLLSIMLMHDTSAEMRYFLKREIF